jgi:hypothetical protein
MVTTLSIFRINCVQTLSMECMTPVTLSANFSELNSQFRLIGHSEQTVMRSNQQSFTFNLILLSEKI